MWVLFQQVGTGPVTSCLPQLEAAMMSVGLLAACYMLRSQILVTLEGFLPPQAPWPHLLPAASISVLTTGST